MPGGCANHYTIRAVPASEVKVCLQEVVEGSHVLLLGKEDVVSDVLHDLTHQGQAALHVGRRLLVDDPRLTR